MIFPLTPLRPMPRTRFVWHLFAGWCAVVAAVCIACFWLASLQLARLADEAQLRRMTDAADGLAAALPTAMRRVLALAG